VLKFEKGIPVAPDATLTPTATRDGDSAIVILGDQSFVIPDAVIFGE
jgi:hypothetical protein